MTAYTDIVKKTINTLCVDLPGGSKDLNALLGRVIENEKQKDGTLKQVTKYTVIDAAMHDKKAEANEITTVVVDTIGSYRFDKKNRDKLIDAYKEVSI